MIFKRTKKGNALLIAIITLAVLGMLGLSHVLTSQMGRKRSAVLFQGIDANFLLEGIIAQTENFIRTQANDYSGKPDWFNKLRTTAIGSDSGWVEVNVSNMAINNLAKQVNAEIKARARFHATDVHRRDNKKTEASVNYGLEKVGQLEIMAQAKVNDAYYIGHAAKDVKIVNPLALSYDGQYNELNSYTMFIKYAMNEYIKNYTFKSGNEEKSVDQIRHGNFVYNKYMDEDSHEKILANYYAYVRLHNGKDKLGRVYMGSSKELRDSIHKFFIDLPGENYGNYYQTENTMIKKYEKEDTEYEFKNEDDETIGKVKMVYYSGSDSRKEKFDLILSAMGKIQLLNIYDYIARLYEDQAGDTIVNHPGTEGKIAIAIGVIINSQKPELWKAVDGWEYATLPYRKFIETTGVAKKDYSKEDPAILIKKPVDWDFEDDKIEGYDFIGLNAYEFDNYAFTAELRNTIFPKVWKDMEDKKNNPISGPMLSDPDFSNDSNNSSSNNDGEKYKNEDHFPSPPFACMTNLLNWFAYSDRDYKKTHYNSISPSSFIEDSLFNQGIGGSDANQAFRAHPVMQLRGKWTKDKGFESETQVEGHVFVRHIENYYLKMEKQKPENDDDNDVKPKVLSEKEKFDNMVYVASNGPEIRRANSRLRGFNSKVVISPYNKDGIISFDKVANSHRIDPDFSNIYLDKITSVYIDYIDFAHNCIKVEDNTMTIYLNGVYLINSAFPIPVDDGIKEVKYVGKGVLLVAGDVVINTDIKPVDPVNDMLIIATVGRRVDKELRTSTIFIRGDGSKRLEIHASLVALNRDYVSQNYNLGKARPNFISSAFGALIKGNWVGDFFYYYPTGSNEAPNVFRGTDIVYDERLLNRNPADVNFYLADIGLPYAFFHVGRQTTSEF
ncbi:MAG: hypothetical protein WC337_06530 [Candidatus Muiribacteriota bacterium]